VKAKPLCWTLIALLANGHVLVLAQETATRSDYLHEVDRDGRLVWQWWPRDHLDEHFPELDYIKSASILE